VPSLSLSPFRPCRSPSDLLSPFLRAGRPPLLARLACPCHAMLMDGATGGRPGFFLVFATRSSSQFGSAIDGHEPTDRSSGEHPNSQEEEGRKAGGGSEHQSDAAAVAPRTRSLCARRVCQPRAPRPPLA
jgi:hypothetical protein